MGKIHVGILFGGRSAEHEVSLRSAQSILAALDRNRYTVTLIGIDKQGQWHRQPLLAESNLALLVDGTRPVEPLALPQAGDLDVIFPVLHGPYGEDGTVQGLLKLAGIPFVGSGVLGSAVGMDKDVMKRLLRDSGIPIGAFVTVLRSQRNRVHFPTIVEQLGLPVFIKPANLGSSVGVSKATTEAEFKQALDLAFQFDHKVLIEAFIPGREIECAVLGNDDPQASVPGEIIPQHDFYSYEAKYLDQKGALLQIPADLPPEVTAQVQRLAIQTFQVLCCSGLARVDFFVRGTQILVNEINTLPGFTTISMYPKLWEASGLGYSALIDRLIELALQNHQQDQVLRTALSPLSRDLGK